MSRKKRKQSARLDDYDESYYDDESDDDAYGEDDYGEEDEEEWDEEDEEDDDDEDYEEDEYEESPPRRRQKTVSSKTQPQRNAVSFARSIGIRESKRKKNPPTSSVIRAIGRRPKPDSKSSKRWRYHNAEAGWNHAERNYGEPQRKPHFWNIFRSHQSEQISNPQNTKYQNAKYQNGEKYQNLRQNAVYSGVSENEETNIGTQKSGTFSAWIRFLFLILVLAGGTWYAFHVSTAITENSENPADNKIEQSENSQKISSPRIANGIKLTTKN